MKDSRIKLLLGSLLHEIWKIADQSGQPGEKGCAFLEEAKKDMDPSILDCVRYQTEEALKAAELPDNALPYITYFAGRVAAAMDRTSAQDGQDFDPSVPLDSVFNLLNGNHGKAHYAHRILDPAGSVNFPTEEDDSGVDAFYCEVRKRLREKLKALELSGEYVHSLLAELEECLSFVPSATGKKKLADISLYDYMKTTAAIAECCQAYMEAQGIQNYREFLLPENEKELWRQPMFLLYSMDVSGIQSFIYTIGSSGALRGLRARSFYLELLMEHIIDELLTQLSLSRACVIYTGGGHCYMLLPNTDEAKQMLATQRKLVNDWFMENFDTALYIADGYAPCTPGNLKNDPKGSYSELFHQVSRSISGKKTHRYSAQEILTLNRRHREGKEECCVCRRTAKLNAEGRCPVCAALEKLSGSILYQDYFMILREPAGEAALPLPGNMFLTAGNRQLLQKLMLGSSYVRSYTVNAAVAGDVTATRLWVGRYTTGDTFGELAEKAEGIERLAVLRGDVDNLGHAFVSGFKANEKYETLSRTAALSRQLSLFFKLHLNSILSEGKSDFLSAGGKRQLSIVYSGGDDIFLAGAWNEVIDSFIDIRNALEKFTEGTLTISGGIGIYDASFPINRMALETAELEDGAKEIPGKNAVTLFDESGRYSWKVFTEEVLADKYTAIHNYMSLTEDRGKAFLYHILELLRGSEGRFNRARFVYYLSRMEPEGTAEDDRAAEKKIYQDFSAKMYQWSMTEEGRRQLVSAIYLYVYMCREREGEERDAD